ncbi:hypothetical protein FB451DRAFT_1386398 [Mycena latifolia]|nr:hypothetical protein FB451DRAFT_1386398 [Mycena latifolia]
MTSTLISLVSRKIRYSGNRCYNARNQPISCPMSRTNLIIIAVIVGIFLVTSLAIFLVTRCTCSCRRRRSTLPTLYRADPEFQQTGGYSQLITPTPSMERLPEPEKIHLATHPYHHY